MPVVEARSARLSPAEQQNIAKLAAVTLCTRSSLELARFARILSDDPQTPSVIPFALYDYQRDLLEAWDGGESTVLLKSRQLGISWTAALYMYRKAALNGWNVGYYSRGKDEAVAELEDRILFIHRNLPEWLRPTFRRRDTLIQFAGGGSIRVFPATRSAGVGYTMQLIVADECAHHEWGAQNYVNYTPSLSKGGQYIAFSTADAELGPAGFFYDLYMGAAAGKTGYTARFLPWHIRPERDAAWLKRERARFDTLTEDEFNSQYPATPGDAFVGKSGLVYPQFSPLRHVKEGVQVRWEDCLYRCAGYDLGGGDPSAIIFLGAYKEAGVYHVHQYGEWVKMSGAPSIQEMFLAISAWHDRAPLAHIEADPVPGGQTVAHELRRLNLPARTANWARGKGLGLVANYLDNDWLSIDATCKRSIHEFAHYNWVERTDPNDRTRYKTSTPHDRHGDCMDGRRYALMGLHNDLMGRVGSSRRGYQVAI